MRLSPVILGLAVSLGACVPAPGAKNGVGGGTHAGGMSVEVSQALSALPLPVIDFYCQGKLSSDGCTPSLKAAGSPSVSDPSPFTVTAVQVTATSPGSIVYGFESAEVPFLGGTLCVGGNPLLFGPQQSSGGSGPCGGSFSFDFKPLFFGVPALVGVPAYAQYGYLDVQDPFGFGMSNAIRFTIQP